MVEVPKKYIQSNCHKIVEQYLHIKVQFLSINDLNSCFMHTSSVYKNVQ